MTYTFTEAQAKNLVEFLNRVEVKGIQENVAFMEIIQAMNKPIIKDNPKK